MVWLFVLCVLCYQVHRLSHGLGSSRPKTSTVTPASVSFDGFKSGSVAYTFKEVPNDIIDMAANTSTTSTNASSPPVANNLQVNTIAVFLIISCFLNDTRLVGRKYKCRNLYSCLNKLFNFTVKFIVESNIAIIDIHFLSGNSIMFTWFSWHWCLLPLNLQSYLHLSMNLLLRRLFVIQLYWRLVYRIHPQWLTFLGLCYPCPFRDVYRGRL